jgi:hypothetical protein
MPSLVVMSTTLAATRARCSPASTRPRAQQHHSTRIHVSAPLAGLALNAMVSLASTFHITVNSLSSLLSRLCAHRPVERPYTFSGAAVSLSVPIVLPDGNRFQASRPLLLEFSFRTLLLNATLFQSSATNSSATLLVEFFSVTLVNGFVTLSFDYGCGPGSTSAPLSVSDGLWHTVVISRACGQGAIDVDRGVVSAFATAVSSADDEATSWRSVFSLAAVGRRAGLADGAALANLTIALCARRCIDSPFCSAFNFLSELDGSTTCELLVASSSTTVSVAADPRASQYYYFEFLFSAFDLVVGGPAQLGASPSFHGCIAGTTLNSWAVDVAQQSGRALPPCA